MADPVVFSRRSRSGGCYAVLVLFGIFPVLALGQFFATALGPIVTTALPIAVVVVAVVLFVGITSEARLEIGPSEIRLTERETVFGVARPEQVIWQLPLDALTHAKEVHTRTPSSRGGWSHAYAIHFPGKRPLRDGMLGARDDRASEYNRLLAWLRERLGSRFTLEEKV